jgi:hypothetical protein
MPQFESRRSDARFPLNLRAKAPCESRRIRKQNADGRKKQPVDAEHFERSAISGVKDCPAATFSMARPPRARETRVLF